MSNHCKIDRFLVDNYVDGVDSFVNMHEIAGNIYAESDPSSQAVFARNEKKNDGAPAGMYKKNAVPGARRPKTAAKTLGRTIAARY